MEHIRIITTKIFLQPIKKYFSYTSEIHNRFFKIQTKFKHVGLPHNYINRKFISLPRPCLVRKYIALVFVQTLRTKYILANLDYKIGFEEYSMLTQKVHFCNLLFPTKTLRDE